MKKVISLIIFAIIVSISNSINNVANANQYYYEHSSDENYATCNSKRTTCYIGEHRMHTSNTKRPLFVTEGGRVVCNNKRTMCTDGRFMRKSSSPFY